MPDPGAAVHVYVGGLISHIQVIADPRQLAYVSSVLHADQPR